MTSAAAIERFGNPSPLRATPERPLVTFAIFGYNQEKYIREAIGGAFSQTYFPLEIILSDDCSSDQTANIMSNMAREYRGPSAVIVRRNARNQGLMHHIISVAEICAGELIVIAAGDDISLAERTATLTELVLRTDSDFVASNYSVIAEDGTPLGQNLTNDYAQNYLWQLINAPSFHFANGAAACYRKSFLLGAFKAAHKTLRSYNVNNEDILLAAYAVATNSVPAHFDAGPLILYRMNFDSISNFRPKSSTLMGEIEMIRREIFWASGRQALLYAILEIASHYPNLKGLLNLDKIHSDLRLAEIEIGASDEHIWRRATTLFKAQSVSEVKIITARLLGPEVLGFMRHTIRKLRHPFSNSGGTGS